MAVAIIQQHKKQPDAPYREHGIIIAFSNGCKSAVPAQWEDYKRWELHFDKVWYLPAKADKKYGVYDIDTKIMRGINFGFEYNFKVIEAWSYELSCILKICL